MELFNMVAPCLFGTESIAAGELRRMGIENIEVQNGRVLFPYRSSAYQVFLHDRNHYYVLFSFINGTSNEPSKNNSSKDIRPS